MGFDVICSKECLLFDWLVLFCFREQEKSCGHNHAREINSGESQVTAEEERDGATHQRKRSRIRSVLRIGELAGGRYHH